MRAVRLSDRSNVWIAVVEHGRSILPIECYGDRSHMAIDLMNLTWNDVSSASEVDGDQPSSRMRVGPSFGFRSVRARFA